MQSRVLFSKQALPLQGNLALPLALSHPFCIVLCAMAGGAPALSYFVDSGAIPP